MSLLNKFNGFRKIWAFDNRFWLLITKIFFRREDLHIYRYKGFEILVDHAGGDANGARDLLTSPMYRRFLPQLELAQPAKVLDLGANNGGFPLLLATEGIELGKVVSVEFNPHTFTRLHFNLTRNLNCEVFPVNAALCGDARTITSSFGKGSSSDSIYAEGRGTADDTATISGITLDKFYETYFKGQIVDICKIDVEGAEFEVFFGTNCSSISSCRNLIIEIHDNDEQSAEELIERIESYGLQRQPQTPDADPAVHLFINRDLLVRNAVKPS